MAGAIGIAIMIIALIGRICRRWTIQIMAFQAAEIISGTVWGMVSKAGHSQQSLPCRQTLPRSRHSKALGNRGVARRSALHHAVS